MRYVEIASWRLSRLGLGTSQLANPGWGYWSNDGLHEPARFALALGYTTVSPRPASPTARGTANGILGAVLGHADEGGVPVARGRSAPNSPTRRAGDGAGPRQRAALGTPAEPVLPPMGQPLRQGPVSYGRDAPVRAQGLVAEVGVGNYDLTRWQVAERHLGAPVLVNQVPYNLLQRDAEEALLPWAATEGRLIVAAQPFATGFLSGAYHEGKRVTGPWRTPDPLYSSGYLRADE